MSEPKISKFAVQRMLWLRGVLFWRMHSVQKQMYDIFNKADPRSTLVWLLARQSGKSFMIVLMCLELCIRKPNTQVALITDTKLHLEGIFEPLFRMILSGEPCFEGDDNYEPCPEEIKPEYHKNKFIYYFPNGSQIHLAGSDGGHAEKLRGKKYDAIFIDEAGFCSNLDYIVTSIILPTLTHTHGKIVMSTTPPEDPDHDFIKFMETAELKGKLTKKTIYDNPLVSKETIQSIIDSIGEESVSFQREYLCKIIRNSDNIVIPEFTEEVEKEIVKEVPKPPMFNSYVAMDLGYKDLTAVLFGYYNYEMDKLVIVDELVISGKELILPVFTRDILKKEREYFCNIISKEFMPPVRVSDINYIVTQEMSRVSGFELNFEPPKKDELGVMINQVRDLIKNKRILIHPRCINLIAHLKNAKWKNASTKLEFGRSPNYGHYDALSALIYMARRVQWNKNPYPAGYGIERTDLYIYNEDPFKRVSSAAQAFQKVFKIKRK